MRIFTLLGGGTQAKQGSIVMIVRVLSLDGGRGTTRGGAGPLQEWRPEVLAGVYSAVAVMPGQSRSRRQTELAKAALLPEGDGALLVRAIAQADQERATPPGRCHQHGPEAEGRHARLVGGDAGYWRWLASLNDWFHMAYHAWACGGGVRHQSVCISSLRTLWQAVNMRVVLHQRTQGHGSHACVVCAWMRPEVVPPP